MRGLPQEKKNSIASSCGSSQASDAQLCERGFALYYGTHAGVVNTRMRSNKKKWLNAKFLTLPRQDTAPSDLGACLHVHLAMQAAGLATDYRTGGLDVFHQPMIPRGTDFR